MLLSLFNETEGYEVITLSVVSREIPFIKWRHMLAVLHDG